MHFRPLILTFGLVAFSFASAQTSPPGWRQVLTERLPLYGHRNWIVVADSAYPAQSRDGIETVVSHADHLQVLQTVLSLLASSPHVNATIHTDRELRYLDESDVKGITAYRSRLGTLLAGRTVDELPHDDIIKQLDQVSQTFRVLIIKTNFALPYTSVFLQLDCAYWTPEQERKLRARMAAQPQRSK